MNNYTEYIHFRKGLDAVLELLPGKEYKPLKKRLMKILDVKTDASLSRHANGESRTPYAKQVKIGNEFVRLGIVNWRGKARKKVKATA